MCLCPLLLKLPTRLMLSHTVIQVNIIRYLASLHCAPIVFCDPDNESLLTFVLPFSLCICICCKLQWKTIKDKEEKNDQKLTRVNLLRPRRWR